jgi:hypothetical protein
MPRPSLATGATAALLLVLSALYFACTISLARHSAAVNDEVFTMWMVRDVPSIPGALKAGVDTAPPTYYLFQRGVCDVLGFTPFALRLPSLLSFFVFLASIFLLLRRYVGVAIAAVGAALPLFSTAYLVADNGRPYAMVLACFGLICLLWCNDERVRPALWGSISIALLLAFAISMHFYAVLLVPLFGCMELVWALQNRVIRWRNWVAMLVGGASLLLSLPVILPINRAIHQTATAKDYYARPDPTKTVEFLRSIMLSPSLEMIYILVLAIGVAVQGRRFLRERRGEAPGGGGVRVYLDHLGTVAFVGFLYPFVSYVFAEVVTKVLNERYLYGTILGVSVGLALILRRLQWGPAPALLVLVVMIAGFAKYANYVRKSHGIAGASDDALLKSAPGNDPIVIPDGPDFFTNMESSDREVRERSVYVLPPVGMHNPNPEPERLAIAWKKIKPGLNVESNEQFLAEHRHFYILSKNIRYEMITGWALNTWHGRVLHYQAAGWMLYEVWR